MSFFHQQDSKRVELLYNKSSYFNPLQIVNYVIETQLQLTKLLNKIFFDIIAYFYRLYYDNIVHFIISYITEFNLRQQFQNK